MRRHSSLAHGKFRPWDERRRPTACCALSTCSQGLRTHLGAKSVSSNICFQPEVKCQTTICTRLRTSIRWPSTSTLKISRKKDGVSFGIKSCSWHIARLLKSKCPTSGGYSERTGLASGPDPVALSSHFFFFSLCRSSRHHASSSVSP